jgi:hypothetical protein
VPDHPEVARLKTKPRLDDIVVLLLVVVVVLFYFVAQGTHALLLFANYGLIAFVGSAGVLGLVSSIRLGKSLPGFLSLGFAVGLIVWMLGLAVYSYTYLIAGVDLPYVSLADVFYFLSYPPMIFGCIGLLRLFAPSLRKADWVVMAVVGASLFIATVDYVVIPSVQTLSGPLEVLTTVPYPLLDVLVFLLLLPLVFAFRKGMFQAPYTLLALGAFLVALGDLVFTYVNLEIGYYDGHPLDLLWFTGCIAYGYGFWRQHAGFKFRQSE